MESADHEAVRGPVNNGPGHPQNAEESEDARLLEAIVDRDEAAFAGLYRRRGPLLYSLLIRMLGDEMEAQEVMQDAFVLIWRRAATYDPRRAAPLSWMLMLARGLALDRLRSRSRRGARQAAYEQELVSLEVEINTPRQAEKDELAAACASALNRLPENQSRPLQLAFLRGWTHEEIAVATGEPLGTIKARIRRGLLALRQALQEYHG